MDISEPNRVFIDPVFAFSAAVKLAGNRNFIRINRQIPALVSDGQRNLGKSHRAAQLGSAENHIFHLVAPQRFGGLFSQHPADCIRNIALSAAVGAYYRCQPFSEFQFYTIRKGLESVDLQIF